MATIPDMQVNVAVTEPAKPGYKTTEFWVAAVIQILTFVQLYFGTISPKLAAVISLTLGILYTASRTIVKTFGTGAQGGDAGTSGDTQPATPPATNFPSLRLTGLLLAFSLLFAGSLAGCAQTESNRIAQGAVLVTAHAHTALWLHDNGYTNATQEAKIAEMLKAEAAAIHAYAAGIDAGDATAVAGAKAALAAATSVTATELAKYPQPPK